MYNTNITTKEKLLFFWQYENFTKSGEMKASWFILQQHNVFNIFLRMFSYLF